MVFLFAPLIFLVVWVPPAISENDAWSEPLMIVVSIILGGIISKHVAEFIRDLREPLPQDGDDPNDP